MSVKRGRPPKNGMQPGWMMKRGMEALYAYDEARKAGEKHSAAVQSAVDAVRAKYPSMPISATEVKRMLSQWRPKGRPIGIIVTKPAPGDDIIILPDGQRARRTLTFGYGPRPNYPRANATTKLKEDRKVTRDAGADSGADFGGLK